MRKQWREIAFTSSASAAHPFTGHHYINLDNTDQQFMVTFFPHGDDVSGIAHVEVKRLRYAAKGETVWDVHAVIPVADPEYSGPAS
jgi:hypothetical protein